MSEFHLDATIVLYEWDLDEDGQYDDGLTGETAADGRRGVIPNLAADLDFDSKLGCTVVKGVGT